MFSVGCHQHHHPANLTSDSLASLQFQPNEFAHQNIARNLK
jgi:hypothetical protein